MKLLFVTTSITLFAILQSNGINYTSKSDDALIEVVSLFNQEVGSLLSGEFKIVSQTGLKDASIVTEGKVPILESNLKDRREGTWAVLLTLNNSAQKPLLVSLKNAHGYKVGETIKVKVVELVSTFGYLKDESRELKKRSIKDLSYSRIGYMRYQRCFQIVGDEYKEVADESIFKWTPRRLYFKGGKWTVIDQKILFENQDGVKFPIAYYSYRDPSKVSLTNVGLTPNYSMHYCDKTGVISVGKTYLLIHYVDEK